MTIAEEVIEIFSMCRERFGSVKLVVPGIRNMDVAGIAQIVGPAVIFDKQEYLRRIAQLGDFRGIVITGGNIRSGNSPSSIGI